MIEFCDLKYVYFPNTPFEKLALSISSLKLEDNQYYGIVGATGSGKSTFLKVLTHLVQPSSGTITIHDSVDDIRKYFGFVFQQPEHQLFCETVQEEIEFSLNNFGIPSDLWAEKIMSALRLVGLSEDFLLKDPVVLSGGEKRRVAIASILAYQPKVLVLDEPTAGVDGSSKEILLDAFRHYHAQGHGIFLVSHDMNLINNECSQALLFSDGQFVQMGNAFDVIRDSKVQLTPGLSVLKNLHSKNSSIDTQISFENFSRLGKHYA